MLVDWYCFPKARPPRRPKGAAQALSDALGGPSATLAGAATHAELDELSNSVPRRVRFPAPPYKPKQPPKSLKPFSDVL